MYQYRIFVKTGIIIRRVFVILTLALGYLVGVETLRLYTVFKEKHTYLGYGFAALLAALFLYALTRWLIHRRDHRILRARGYTISNRSSHARLKKNLLHHIHCIKRLSHHSLLTDDQAAAIRQRADDIQDILHHHPLNDDLLRAIDNAREQVIKPTFHYLDGIALKITRAKIRAAIQDIYQPPFPVIPPLVVVYHQITLVSEITDTYLARPSHREYVRTLLDVWQIMTKGDYLRYGQRIFSGINSNPYSLARTGEDVGHALSITWLTHAIAAATRQRCTTLHDWNIQSAIEEMKEEVSPCLERTRDSLAADVMPHLKARIRHYSPYGSDPDQFVEQISQALFKSVDSVVLTLASKSHSALQHKQTSHQPDVSSLFDINPQQAPSGETTGETTALPGTERTSQRRRRRRRRENGLKSLLQRLLHPRPRLGK